MADYNKLLSRAAKLCSTSEKCSHDVLEKLRNWGLEEEEALKAIKYLEDNKFLNDNRYARFFVRDKLRFNKWGRIKISYALRNKKVPSEIIEAALDTIDNEEYESALEQLLEAKIRSVGNIKEARGKAKILRFAAQRGFTSEETFRALGRLKID
ncbi:MAG: regulatory protein RecX [Bacteroidales bacterium]